MFPLQLFLSNSTNLFTWSNLLDVHIAMQNKLLAQPTALVVHVTTQIQLETVGIPLEDVR